ncbi:MAG: WecB/TagA/CpsF family glycosyltransferase [bacterium]|nr:WecB/TagA/CpsF family glycosyltransferase [bacterium]
MLGISLRSERKKDILDKIIKNIKGQGEFIHIVSVNPENLVVADKNEKFKKVIQTAQIHIIDGIGIVIAGRLLGEQAGERVGGVDLMRDIVKLADRLPLRIVLIGGSSNLANKLAECYSHKYPASQFKGIEGIRNILSVKKEEEEGIFSIVARLMPHIVFVAFGSPEQEMWIDRHKEKFQGMVCMGVGGAFDYLSGSVPRAPQIIRRVGLEWLFRLIVQPWRWKRQLRLIEFMWLVMREKIYQSSKAIGNMK